MTIAVALLFVVATLWATAKQGKIKPAFVQKAMKDLGVDPEKETKIIATGENPQRLAALANNITQFTLLGEPLHIDDEAVRLAVDAGLYPVIEIVDGHELYINVEPEMSFDALAKYFASQGRFKGSREDVEAVRREIERSWRWLRARAALAGNVPD